MPTWLTAERMSVIIAALAAAISLVAIIYARRQTAISAEAKLESRRSADAAEESAIAAKQVAEIEMRREHRDCGPQGVRMTFEKRKNQRTPTRLDAVAVLEHGGTRDLRFKAQLVYSGGAREDLVGGELHAGDRRDLHVGFANSFHDRIEMWFDGECPCGNPESKQGHWQRIFLLKESETA